MDVISYATRPSIATVETTYQVTDDELIWSSGPAQNRMRLADIQTVRLFTSPSVKYPFLGNAPFGGYDLFVVLRSVLGVVTRGRQKSFDPRIGPPQG